MAKCRNVSIITEVGKLLSDIVPVNVRAKLVTRHTTAAFAVDVDSKRWVAWPIPVGNLFNLTYRRSAIRSKFVALVAVEAKKKLFELRARRPWVHSINTNWIYCGLNYHKVILLAIRITKKEFTFC